MQSVKLDLNTPQFQKDLLSLQSGEQVAILRTLKKIAKMTWQQLYQDPGLKWEAISRRDSQDQRIHSFRFSQKYRATATRQGEYLRPLSLHVDHDSAYI